MAEKRFQQLRDHAARRALTYASLGSLLILIAIGLDQILRSALLLGGPITVAIVMVLVVLIFEPLRRLVQKGIDRTFFREQVRFDLLLETFSHELMKAVNVEELITALFDSVKRGLPGVSPQLFLHDEARGGYGNYRNDSELLLESSSPFVQFARDHSGAIETGKQRAWLRSLDRHGEKVLALNADVIVPVKRSQQLLGLLALSGETGEQRFRPAELNFLADLAELSALGLERTSVISQLEARVAELDMLGQFSRYVNFTIVIDDLLELVYTNHQRLLGIQDFFVYWKDPASGQMYTLFHVEGDERIRAKEGRDRLVDDPRVLQVVESGQMVTERNESGCTWIINPLNAGADTLGALKFAFDKPGSELSERQEQLLGIFANRTAVALDRLHTRQQLETRAQQLEIINQVTLSLASTLELEPLLNLILDKAIELLDTEAGTFMLMREDTGELEFRVVRGPTSQDLLGTRLPIGTGLAGTVAQTGQPILVNRARDDKRWFDRLDASTDFQSQTILSVPLLRQSTVLGVLQVINRRNGGPFGEDDQMLLTAFASQAVVALENARLLEQTDRALQERVNELFMLQQLDRDLNTTLDLDRVLNLTLNWILRICHGTAGAIALSNEEHQLHLEATSDQAGNLDAVSSSDIWLRAHPTSSVFETGEPHVSGNVHDESDYVAIAETVHSQMTLPVIHKQNLIGVIAIGSDRFDAFDEAALDTGVRVTNHAAVAIANAILYEQVNEANLAKSEFVSMVSHELKTPMTSMRGYTDLMLSGMTGELNDQQQAFLSTIAANIRRMSKQIQDLTDISRIETGRLRMETAPTSFSNIISETLQSVQGPYDSKNIELQLDLPPDLPQVLADQERLVQVLTNLLSNACKYSPPSTTVTITLRTELIALEENSAPIPMVVCSIKDNGYGISEQDQNKLFTKFFRAEDPNIRKATGTGLGLSISKGIIDFHGGKIWVESTLGKGTTFHFAIPQLPS